jgi:hypothetical protein
VIHTKLKNDYVVLDIAIIDRDWSLLKKMIDMKHWMREREVIEGEVEDDTLEIGRGIIQMIDQESPLQVMIALMAEIITVQVNILTTDWVNVVVTSLMRQTVLEYVQVVTV